jgi:hypothetical protein
MLRTAAPCKALCLASVRSEDLLFRKASSHGEKTFTPDRTLQLFISILGLSEGGSECSVAHRPPTSAFECKLHDAPRVLVIVTTSVPFTPESMRLHYDAAVPFDAVCLQWIKL